MKFFLKKAGVFIGTNWKIIALCGLVVVGYLLFRKREQGFAEKLKEIQDIHRQELKEIDKVRAEEKALHEANERRLRQALETVQLEYEKAKQELSNAKKKEVTKIVKDIGNDPMALAQKLSEATGFKIVLSEDWGK